MSASLDDIMNLKSKLEKAYKTNNVRALLLIFEFLEFYRTSFDIISKIILFVRLFMTS